MINARKPFWLGVVRLMGNLVGCSALAAALAACAHAGLPNTLREFHRTLKVTANGPLTLDVRLSQGELQIAYSRNDQVSIAATAQVPDRAITDESFFATILVVEQDGNHLRIRNACSAGPGDGKIRIVCRIDVPYLTEVNSLVENGKQTITGIMGPVAARTRKGDIKVSYVSKSVLAEAASGNLDLEVIGERVEARTGNGNISCIRAVQGASAETGDGDILLMVVGPSKAIVKKGTGRIDISGARGSLMGSTTEGDLHIKAIPHDDWRLISASGNIRVELPPAARFEADATTIFGEILINRDDVEKLAAELRHLHQKVNGGGRRIEMHTDSGKIILR